MTEKDKSLDPTNLDAGDEEDGIQAVQVYDVELMDEAEETGVVPKKDPPPSRGFAEKVGRAAGTVLAVLGLLADIRGLFRSSRGNGSGTPRCDGTGRGMGRGLGQGMGRGLGRARKNRRRNS